MANIIKGVPQGSILGLLIFNIFMNDIFYFLEKSTLYNYADDNAVSYCHKIYQMVFSVLQIESATIIECLMIITCRPILVSSRL